MKIILASKSPYRKKLLERLGINFECVSSEFDESTIKQRLNCPVEISKQLSKAKALTIKDQYKDCIIIGSDQVCALGDELLSKPKTFDKGLTQLSKMQGRSHRLITSYYLYSPNQCFEHTNVTTLKMKSLSENQIKKYLNSDNPIDCAGSYKLELQGISLMESIDTEDSTAIIGLPLIQLGHDLNKLGICIPPE